MPRVKYYSWLLCLWWVAALPRPLHAHAARPTLFLQCPSSCFEGYVQEQLSYFDFMRAPHLAQLTVLVVRQPAGNGGEHFTVGITDGAGLKELGRRAFSSEPGATEHALREQLVQATLRALHAALATSSHEHAFKLSLPTRDGEALSALYDPWDYWTVAPELGGNAEGERGYYFAELTGALTLRRVTSASKIRLRGAYTRALSGYDLGDDGFIRGDVYAFEVRSLYALSLGRRWALGLAATARSSEFENLRAHAHGGAILELNVFPYVESQHHQLRFAYQVGPWVNAYFEPNAAGLIREARPYHALSLVADAHMPWGSVQWVGQLSSFIDEPQLYRIGTGASVALALWRGLVLSLEGRAAYVRDLINLRGRAITDEELILWTAQQHTDYTFEGGVSFVYTFGSVHNAIVNPRFERMDVEED